MSTFPDGRRPHLILSRYTPPEPDHKIQLQQLKPSRNATELKLWRKAFESELN
jgi:hypothetical protein